MWKGYSLTEKTLRTILPHVTSKPKKKDSDMKIDKTTHKDKEENQNGMTADRTSRPAKVLFFANPLLLFFKESTHIWHIAFCPKRKLMLHKSQRAKLSTLNF